MNVRLVLGGLKSYLPLPAHKYKGTGGTSSGAYCYTVWLRHLTLIKQSLGTNTFNPDVVVELGPGDSIGLGLAALLTGSKTYIGLDVLTHASQVTNLRVLEELVTLFRHRADLPDELTFPRLYPRIRSYGFPAHLINDQALDERLADKNIERLRDAIENKRDDLIQYRAPWNSESVAATSVDLVISQGALQDMDHEPINDLRRAIFTMAKWLKSGGVMSHHIDLSCPGGDAWNHHWAYGDLVWKLIRGNRPYYKNRVPLSEYVSLFEQADCEVVAIEPLIRQGLSREVVASQFRRLPDDDFRTAAALLIMKKR